MRHCTQKSAENYADGQSFGHIRRINCKIRKIVNWHKSKQIQSIWRKKIRQLRQNKFDLAEFSCFSYLEWKRIDDCIIHKILSWNISAIGADTLDGCIWCFRCKYKDEIKVVLLCLHIDRLDKCHLSNKNAWIVPLIDTSDFLWSINNYLDCFVHLRAHLNQVRKWRWLPFLTLLTFDSNHGSSCVAFFDLCQSLLFCLIAESFASLLKRRKNVGKMPKGACFEKTSTISKAIWITLSNHLKIKSVKYFCL